MKSATADTSTTNNISHGLFKAGLNSEKEGSVPMSKARHGSPNANPGLPGEQQSYSHQGYRHGHIKQEHAGQTNQRRNTAERNQRSGHHERGYRDSGPTISVCENPSQTFSRCYQEHQTRRQTSPGCHGPSEAKPLVLLNQRWSQTAVPLTSVMFVNSNVISVTPFLCLDHKLMLRPGFYKNFSIG